MDSAGHTWGTLREKSTPLLKSAPYDKRLAAMNPSNLRGNARDNNNCALLKTRHMHMLSLHHRGPVHHWRIPRRSAKGVFSNCAARPLLVVISVTIPPGENTVTKIFWPRNSLIKAHAKNW